ncbi:MAG: lipoate--protein ligase family protein [Limisphaerales bacterium]
MKLLDLTLPTPAENLACEEALLDACDEHGGDEILRFWQAHETFVVVGYANRIASEVNIPVCAAGKIPVFRRCSGGGTVLQGRGGLNYALILRITEDGPLRNITSANQFIMERNRAAIESIFPRPQTPDLRLEITVSGHTDLALNGLKFSGNSQRRKRNFLLFHGTFLLNFNLALVSEFLRMPSLQPDYRAGRSHDEFLVNLNLSVEQVKAALQKVWSTTDGLKDFPIQETQRLVTEKYSTDGWNLKF